MSKTLLMLVMLAMTALVAAPPAPAADSGGAPEVPGMAEATKLIEQEKHAEAVPHLAAAHQKAPTNADVLNLLGYTHRKLGKLDEAQDYYARALKIDPDHKGALNYLGQLYLETGRPDEARKILARLDKACFFGCKEYDWLKQAVASGKAGKY